MRREQLAHAIRTACQIIGRSEVIVVGSQAILGTYTEGQLPPEATMSIEVDVLPIDDDEDEIDRLADLIKGAAGEFSPFDETHGFHIDGVDLGTAILPAGWRDRLVKVQNANTAAPGGHPRFTGWCLDKEDLCVAKLCAHREKDLNFVGAPLDHRLVDSSVIVERLAGWTPPTPAPRMWRACGRALVPDPTDALAPRRGVPLVSEHPPDRSDEQTSEEETASLLANPEALRDLDAARDQIARGECVRGVDAVRALRPR